MLEPHTPRRDSIRSIAEWLLNEGIAGTQFDILIENVCKQLVSADVPLMRANLSMRSHHPEIGAFAYRWKKKEGLIHEQYDRVTMEGATTSGWENSPLKHLVESNNPEMRNRLNASEEPYPFPMFYELVEMGATDYYATRLLFSDISEWRPLGQESTASGLLASFASDGENGFSDRDLDDLRFLIPHLGLALKSNSNYKMADDLLATYLGGDAGARVMSGDIGRGSLQTIQAVILYVDLKGFTKLSEALPGDVIIELLNDYFGTIVPLIEMRGGNVLKFMGDGILAIFDQDKITNAELSALRTIDDMKTAVADINIRRSADGLQTTGFTVAAHGGEVLYGNIGSSSRLDFTVIGPAVNTAARISGMTANVDQDIVIGANVAKPLLELRDDLVSLGQYRLRGVADRQELFTLD